VQVFLALALIAAWTLPARADDEGPLTIADLAAYRAALEPTKSAEAAPPVTFRDLWDRPGEFRGRRIAVGGRVERVFHDGPVGQFPALAEVWIYSPASDPFCLVFPETKDDPAPKPGDLIRFEGTFLRRVKYRGGDVDRLAPLVVGPASPRVEEAAAPKSVAVPSGSPFDGMFVLVIGGIVALGLLRAHLRRPSPRPIVIDPPPEFQDGHQ
jgi:hypothetical protein